MKLKSQQWMWVGLGGASGTLARGGMAEVFSYSTFPTATLIVNLVGSLLLGGFTAYLYFKKHDIMHLLFGIGFCGSFTTMSMFAADSILLIDTSIHSFLWYALTSVIGGILLATLGFWVIKNIYERSQAA
ncbi:fluoride efflux transporter FluC [Piscibacillus halophilus]|uniref:Fluoride-specific ion channel FluC n=1 Tax=Piscibacillus halophilus TaxID=571933 RepID=A0A1H9G794_9BACI|nr:CrcB family protein [Piscibacillus halophilus]SEQ45893.1 CrcB protein [Piscibacillus halophilus]